MILLSLSAAGPFVVVGQPADGTDGDGFVIRAPQPSGPVIASLRMLQLIYGLDATPISRVQLFAKDASENDVPEMSFDPVSTHLLTNPNRGPPPLAAIL